MQNSIGNEGISGATVEIHSSFSLADFRAMASRKMQALQNGSSKNPWDRVVSAKNREGVRRAFGFWDSKSLYCGTS